MTSQLSNNQIFQIRLKQDRSLLETSTLIQGSVQSTGVNGGRDLTPNLSQNIDILVTFKMVYVGSQKHRRTEHPPCREKVMGPYLE
jgi:hypothetical protein